MKPEPMTPEQIETLLDETIDSQDGAQAIIAARDAQWEELLGEQEPVAQLHPNHFKPNADGSQWCREVLLYSPNNEGDKLGGVNTRVKLYTHPVPAQEPVNQQLLDALKSLYGPLNDPKVGWRGRTHDNPEEFQCEYCKAVNLDCSQIHHAETCPTVLAQAAIAAAEKELK